MKKLLSFLIAVAGAFILLDFLIGVMMSLFIGMSGFRFARLYSGTQINADVVVVGNSRAVNSFYVPAISKLTRKHWYNLGYNGMGPRMIEAVLLDYLDLNKKPDLVVIEVSNLWQDINPIRDLRLFAQYSPRLRDLDMCNDGFNAGLAAYSHAFSCNGEMFLRIMNYIGRDDQGWVNSGRMNAAHAENAIQVASRSIKEFVNSNNIETYRRIFGELRKRGVRYRCVIGPYLIDDVAHSRLISAVNSCVSSGGVIDHSMLIKDYNLYADPLHLNKDGSLEYAKLLCRELGDFDVCNLHD